MKTLLTLFVLFFSSLVVADDISDFEIEGMSIGDSLLTYFSESKIQTNFYPNSKKFAGTMHLIDTGVYDTVRIHYKMDKKFIIHGIGGLIFYMNNIDSCYEKENEIINSLESKFPSAKKYIQGKQKHDADPTGKSIYTLTEFSFENGSITIQCTDWSKSITSELGWHDYLGYTINTNEFINWLSNEAY